MELRHLRHLIAVAEEEHMGRAALRLGMAQPPLSQSIARLEKSLGVALFHRANRRLALTPAGLAMLEDARATLRHAGQAREQAIAAAAGAAGQVRIGFVSAATYQHLPALLRRLRETHPALRPQLLEGSTNEQLAALEQGRLDVGFVHPPLGATTLPVLDLGSEPLVAAVPEDGTSDAVTLGEIARRGLILFPAAQGPSLHARILDAFGAAGASIRRPLEASRALTMLSMVSAGCGVALLPRSTTVLSFRGVRFAAVKDSQDLPQWPLALAARPRPRPPVIDLILGLMREATRPP